MLYKSIPLEFSVKDGLELFKKLGIEVKSADCLNYESGYHNQVTEVKDKRLMAICPHSGKPVDFIELYKKLLASRTKEVILSGTTQEHVINLIKNLE